MNAAAIHLALNHFPPILDLAGLIVLVIGITWKSQVTVRAGLIVLILAALIAIPVFLTGEPAEEIVEGMEGVNDVAIHPHEDAGKWAFWVLCAQGAIALVALVKPNLRWALIVTLVLTVMATIAAFRTAYLGGKIHHPETTMTR